MTRLWKVILFAVVICGVPLTLAARVHTADGAISVSTTITKGAGDPAWPANAYFDLWVACSQPNVPVVGLRLDSAHGYAATTAVNIAPNSHCQVSQVQTSPVPADLAKRGCRFEPPNPFSQDVVMTAPGTTMALTIQNTWSCKVEDNPNPKVPKVKASITVNWIMVNTSKVPTPKVSLQVQLDGKGCPTAPVTMTMPGVPQTVGGLEDTASCTISALPPAAPRGCHFDTTYPKGRIAKAGASLELKTELLCSAARHDP